MSLTWRPGVCSQPTERVGEFKQRVSARFGLLHDEIELRLAEQGLSRQQSTATALLHDDAAQLEAAGVRDGAALSLHVVPEAPGVTDQSLRRTMSVERARRCLAEPEPEPEPEPQPQPARP